MPKPKIYIVKADRRYRVMRYNKATGELILQGAMRSFKSTLAHAQQAGYSFVKEVE